jgi:high-affinity nickel permease
MLVLWMYVVGIVMGLGLDSSRDTIEKNTFVTIMVVALWPITFPLLFLIGSYLILSGNKTTIKK